MTKEERAALIHELTSNAGKARLVRMSPKERSAVAKLGAEARWRRYREEKKRTNSNKKNSVRTPGSK